LGTTTRTEYKTVTGKFTKRKVRLCVMVNQQKEGVHNQLLGELYAPVMKAAEVQWFMAIAGLLAAKHKAQTHCVQIKDQAGVLNGEIRDEKIYI
jgi:hypothetical protein